MRRRFPAVVGATMCVVFVLIGAAPALACGGLIGPNGGVSLVKTTTLAGYHDGVEHYVTAFSFTGGTGNFGSIIPLPGVPTKVEKGGNWTLQRLGQGVGEPRAVGHLRQQAAAGTGGQPLAVRGYFQCRSPLGSLHVVRALLPGVLAS